ncbi:MAG: hypothetical protein Q8O91_05060 [Candidatus Aminicenantes bacterium]|nr:hypothetical protein [Candidatus Aminicenantes bacterium]
MIQRVRVFKNFKEAEKAEIQDGISLTPNQRLKIVHSLRIRIFGRRTVDIRSHHKKT